MHLRDLHERLGGFARATSEGEIRALCEKEARDLGFDAFIYALRFPTTFTESRIVQVRGYPDAWLERYWERSYFAIDPVIAYATRHVLPVDWSALVPNMSGVGRKMMGEAGEFGLRSGVTMPVHGPDGELGMLSLADDRRPLRPADRAHVMTLVQVLAPHVHEAVRRVAGPREAPAPALTHRERECLRWAADGKTSWEISQLCNIAERTVNFHFDNAVTKLKAANRQHAIAVAIARNILSPHPF